MVTNCSGYFSGNLGALEIQGQDGMLIYNNTMTLDRSDGLNGDIIYGVEGFLKNVKIFDNILNKNYIPGTTRWDFAIEFWNCLGGVEIYGNNINGSVDLVNTSSGTSSYSVWIHDNTIGQSTLLSSESVRGILLEENHSNVIIERNLIRNVAEGVYLNQFGSARRVTNIYIHTNIFSNIGVSDSGSNSKGWGIEWASETYKNHSVNNINICNNVILGHVGSRSNMWGLNLPNIGTARNITIRNNIIRDFDYAAVYASTQTGSETIDILSIENNIFYNNGYNNLPRYSGITPSNNTTRNNITSDPLFLSSTDLHLQSRSPAIGKGLNISGITADFEGNAVNDPPSIGAYEYFVAVIPVYQSSLVANAAPSVLEMNYDHSLSSIIPASSAFTVMVNSSQRNVTSVSISGTKVRLTLSSAVVAGDAILVSYTKPAENPLQTPSGGLAENIASRPAANNVLSVIPVYSSSVIENLTPSKLTITFNLSLANIVPASTAFTVTVNSVTRIVSSVSISGNKAILTLTDPVEFGEVVTLSYTRPATGLLQGISGGEVANIANKPVTNHVANPELQNDPPVIVINSNPVSYSGFVGELDASLSHDPDNDQLTFQWTPPPDIPVSSVSGPFIRYLSPLVSSSQSVIFQLTVSDGINSAIENIPVEILPYKSEIPALIMPDIKASSFEEPYAPQNAIDGDPATYWSVWGENQWLTFRLAEPSGISHLIISFLRDQNYTSTFDILASRDNITWEPVLIHASTCDFSGAPQVFNFPDDLNMRYYSYVRFAGYGNSIDKLNIVSEFRAFGFRHTGNIGNNQVILYPNPAVNYFFISVSDDKILFQKVRITDLSGRVVFEDIYTSEMEIVRIPSTVRDGIYIVELLAGTNILYAQKLIVKRISG